MHLCRLSEDWLCCYLPAYSILFVGVLRTKACRP